MPQISMAESIKALDEAGLVKRYSEQLRVDELPRAMEDNPDQAVLVENVKDCAFPFFANGYGVRAQWALALDCDITEVGAEMARRAQRPIKPVMVDDAPCQEVVIKGDDVDLTMLPLFLHHPKDGQAYLNDTNVVSRDPDTGMIGKGIYRFMYRSKNETNIDMRNATHGARIHAERNQELGRDTPIAVLIGGSTLDHLASMMSNPDEDGWDVLGGYYGEPAKLVKCMTSDLTIPANSELVIEGRIISTEGWVHDEGPYGEYTGTYGGGLPHNNRFVVDCITHRKDMVYQYATIGGLHPGRTDMAAFHPAIESDLYNALKQAGVLVQNVYLPPDGCSNIGYAAIKTRSGGDAKQALAIMLTGSRQWMPKLAYVFDDDVDIYDDARVKWAQAWRLNPETGIVLLPGQNMLPLDPSLNTDMPPNAVTKVGFDCTIPLIGDVDSFSYKAAVVAEPLPVDADVDVMPDDEIATRMEKMIRDKPRMWSELLAEFASQPYPNVYRAFGQLRPRLGRMADQRPDYPYTFSDEDFVHTADKTNAGAAS